MDTVEISNFLSKIDPKLQYNVFPCNRLPIFHTLPIYIISNLDPDTKPGSHWVAIYVSIDGAAEYFDSYGRKPNAYYLRFLRRNCKIWTYNNKTIQNDYTSVCGEYCLVYLYYKVMGKRMEDFVSNFSDNTLCNDLIIRKMFVDLFS